MLQAINLLEDDPGDVVPTANLYVDLHNCAKLRHGKIDIIGPVAFRYAHKLQFEFLFQGPVTSSIACKQST